MDNSVGANIRERTFLFGCAVATASLEARRPGAYALLDQLLRSSTSVGANLEEAKAASSRKEFVRFCEIALREGREAVYWIRICIAVGVLPPERRMLEREGEEISKILAVIVIKSKRRMKVKAAGVASLLLGITQLILNFAF
jgi:four helix bundle protein